MANNFNNYYFLSVITILTILLLLTKFSNLNNKSFSSPRSKRSINYFYDDYELSNLDGISARAGEVEFFRLSLVDDSDGDQQGNEHDQYNSEDYPKTNTKIHKNQDQNKKLKFKANKFQQKPIQFLNLPTDLEILHDTSELELNKDSLNPKLPKYPDILLNKIKETEATAYYLDFIQKAALEMEGKDLIWWGYNKTHEFFIDRKALDAIDINKLKITDNLAEQLGKPKPNSVIVKASLKSNQLSEKLNDDFNSESYEIASWKIEKEKLLQGESEIKPQGILLISPLAGEVKPVEDLFNNIEQAYYMYEPLKIIGEGCSNSGVSAKMDFLSEILNCKFNNLTNKINNLKITDEKSSRFVGKGGVVFRYKTNRLCKNEYCNGNDYSGNEDSCMKLCPDVNLKQISETCESRTPVLKIIRVCNIETLQPLIEKTNNKVIYLIKDPRSLYISRTKTFKTWSPTEIINSLKWTCLDTVKSLRTLLITENNWTKNKFMVLKAEDISNNSTIWLKNMLNFGKFNLNSEDVKEYLDENKNNERFKEVKSEIDNWKNNKLLDSSTIKKIQDVCYDMMKMADYKLV